MRSLGARYKIMLAGLVLVPVVACGGVLAYRWTHTEAPAFRTVAVVRVDITEFVTATGTLQPLLTSPVGAQVSGIIWKLHADYNSPVKAGDLLVELEPTLFVNAVAQATALLAQAEANLTSAQATALGARITRNRTLSLERESLASIADVDSTAAIFGQTAGLSRSGAAQVALARAQLDKAKLDLEHSVIRSPVDGAVITRSVDIGQAVASTLTAPTLFTIAQDMHQMQAHAAVDEADIGGVRAGQPATFTVDAYRDQTFPAVVFEVRNSPQTANNVVTYDVVLNVENPQLKLRPGMTTNVLIRIVHRSQVEAVPNEALRFRPVTVAAAAGSAKAPPKDQRLGAAVYVPQGRAAQRVPVHQGATDGTMTEVAGLQLGQQVIIDVTGKPAKVGGAGGPGHGI